MRCALSFFLLFAAFSAHSAILFCGPSSSGSGSGADFNNLLASPTTGGVRGNVYRLIDGSYGNITLGTAASGTTTITFEKVTNADSGVAGYSPTLHDGVAAFGSVTVNDPYYIFDGKTRTESDGWTAPTGYGFSASSIGADSVANGDDADFLIVRYVDIGPAYEVNPSAGTIATYDQPVRFVYDQTGITFTRCAIHGAVGALAQLAGADNLTFEYCNIGPGWGKEALRGGNGSLSSGWIIRYNRFWESTQTDPNDGSSGITAEIGIWDWTGTASGFQIYGNWFFNSKSGGRNSVILVGGDGGGWAGDGADGTVVYNNTFAGIAEGSVFAMVDLNGASTVARNNLFYDCVDTDVSATTASDNDVAGVDPFVNYAILDLHLSGSTADGFALPPPFDTDPDGNTRGTGGIWDVGTFQFVTGGNPTNSSIFIPTSLRVTTARQK